MRLKIILLTLVSGVTALVLAQNSPNSPGNPTVHNTTTAPAPINVPGSPPVTPQNVSPTQNLSPNGINTNGMTGTNLSVSMIGIGTGSNVNGASITNFSIVTNSQGRF